MANTKKFPKNRVVVKKSQNNETDGAYFLKIVLYLILGSMWLRVNIGESGIYPLPVGLLVGLIFASHEHFQLDRKIEYVVILIAAFIGFWLPIGINIIL